MVHLLDLLPIGDLFARISGTGPQYDFCDCYFALDVFSQAPACCIRVLIDDKTGFSGEVQKRKAYDNSTMTPRKLLPDRRFQQQTWGEARYRATPMLPPLYRHQIPIRVRGCTYYQ